MAVMFCKCGYRMSNTGVPNDIEFHVYSDREWDDLLRNDIVATLNLPKPKNDVWKCPFCERLYIFSDDGTVLRKYVLEND